MSGLSSDDQAQQIQALLSPYVDRRISALEEKFEQKLSELEQQLKDMFENRDASASMKATSVVVPSSGTDVLARAPPTSPEPGPGASKTQLTAGATNDTLHQQKQRLEIYTTLATRAPDYKHAESVWDSCTFLKMGVLDFSDSAMIIFCALLNMLMQGVFVYSVAQSNMTDGDLSDDRIVTTMLRWRALYGQSAEYADPRTGHTLTRQVCEQSQSLMFGAVQQVLYGKVSRYEGTVAPFVSMLAILVWLLTVYGELMSIWAWVCAVWGLRYSSRGGSSVVNRTVLMPDGESILLKSMSWRRATALSVLVILPRFAICSGLGVFGVYFLARTYNPRDLILNSVKLGVVLGIDELIFKILAPEAVVLLVRKTKIVGLPRGSSSVAGSIRCVGPWKRAAVMAGVIAIVWFLVITPTLATMGEVRRVMCSGNLDYVTSDSSLGFTNAANLSTRDMDDAFSMDSYSIVAKLQLSSLREVAHHTEDYYFHKVAKSGANTIQSVSTVYNREDFVAKLPCENLEAYLLPKVPVRALLRELLRDKSINGCADAAPYCLGQNGTDIVAATIRALCPAACGCTNPRVGSIYGQIKRTFDGCPRACKAKWNSALEQIPCVDAPANSTGLRYAVEEIAFNEPLSAMNMPSDMKQWPQRLEGLNCSELVQTPLRHPLIGSIDICAPSAAAEDYLGSIAPLCPRACNCSSKRANTTGPAPKCPAACRNKTHTAGGP